MNEDPRPDGCCGKCPPLIRGGYDCTCRGNERCQTPQDAAGRDETLFRVLVGMDDMEDAQTGAGEGEQ